MMFESSVKKYYIKILWSFVTGVIITTIISGAILCIDIRNSNEVYLVSDIDEIRMVETNGESNCVKNAVVFKDCQSAYFTLHNISKDYTSFERITFNIGENIYGDIEYLKTGNPVLTISTPANQGVGFILGPGYNFRYGNVNHNDEIKVVYHDFYFDGQFDLYTVTGEGLTEVFNMAYINGVWCSVNKTGATTVAIDENKFVADKTGCWEKQSE